MMRVRGDLYTQICRHNAMFRLPFNRRLLGIPYYDSDVYSTLMDIAPCMVILCQYFGDE